MPSLRPVKRGGTFSYEYSLPIDFANSIETLEIQLRQSDGTLIQQILVNPLPDTDTHGRWQISATPEQTAAWPLKNLSGDIKHIAIDGTVIHTETFTVSIIKAITI